ncbi:hypothetical protein LS68_004270 [Helicobacter sp. MIT 05-5293]|uniref:Protein trl n=1 Tax=uncultured Helicobacter sp. TaxID=175537 RepID=A0A650EKS7_9HELI|nr:TRL-like family protein [Helicobacter sp. MIT 05-5293]QGT50360.1 hypothetical protein Helico5904_0320 [uncultured Helicobacter sp.]TLD82214.1 hypothetical protein LS68_004270 [Helicobacter sp. MIT 05-5293]
MKKFVLALGLGASLAFFSGCGGVIGAENGLIFSDNTTPITATSSSSASREGSATCTNILGLVALGDCSVNTAASNGSISQIKSVDSKNFSILGIYTTKTTIVKGN